MAWSSDSRWIYFSKFGSNNEIVRAEVLKDGSAGNRQEVTKEKLVDYLHKAYPVPSSSLRYMVFSAAPEKGPWQLFLIDLQHLNAEPRLLLSPTWIASDAFVLNERLRLKSGMAALKSGGRSARTTDLTYARLFLGIVYCLDFRCGNGAIVETDIIDRSAKEKRIPR